MGRIISVLFCAALAGAHAALVVDLTPAEVPALVAARAPDADGAEAKTFNWSAAAPLWIQVDGSGTTVYGGLHYTRTSSDAAMAGPIASITSSKIDIRNPMTDSSGDSKASGLLLWDAADFTAVGTMKFDNTAESFLAIETAYGTGNANGTGLRFVIRDGGTYYVSNIGDDDLDFVNGDPASMNGTTPGLQWAAFDPNSFTTFDQDAANYGLGTLSFSAQTFGNVTGVGFLFNISRPNNAAGSRLDVLDFQAGLNTDTDTSLPGYGSHPFEIMETKVSNDVCTVYWESALNQRFTVERSNNLSTWAVLATNYPPLGADSNTVYYTDPTVSPSQSFYRVSRPYDPNKKLNVLMIVVDDLRDHEEFAGHNTVYMPNLDRFAAKGIKFKHAYCQATFCNPSRASFLTGLRPDTTGIADNTAFFRDSTNPVVANAVTLPQCFRSNGYYTASLGKILHGTQMDPLSWNLQQNSFPAPALPPVGQTTNMTDGALGWCRWGAPDCEDNELDDGAMAERAVEILREKRTVPFFLAVGFHKPHDPFIAPKKYFDLYPLTNLVLHADPPDASPPPPLAVPSGGSLTAFNAMDDNDRLEFLRCYAACSTYADAQVGKVFDALDELGLWQNTIVLLWTDHGYHQGERGWWNKTLLYEYDAKVPLMAYVPQLTPSGVVCTGVVELVDVYPTLTELAGIAPPPNLEGESFVPLIGNPGQPWSGVGISQKSTGRTVCDGRFRYTEWSDGAKELYDHASDPGEWYNLAGDPAYVDIMQTLRGWIE
jgi:iduronate 2-sulfatase